MIELVNTPTDDCGDGDDRDDEQIHPNLQQIGHCQSEQEGAQRQQSTRFHNPGDEFLGWLQALHLLPLIGLDYFVGIDRDWVAWDNEVTVYFVSPGIPSRLSATGEQLQIGTV